MKTVLQPDTDKPWTELAAALYQACGAYDLPERILDILVLAASDKPFGHLVDGLLPCCPEPERWNPEIVKLRRVINREQVGLSSAGVREIMDVIDSLSSAPSAPPKADGT